MMKRKFFIFLSVFFSFFWMIIRVFLLNKIKFSIVTLVNRKAYLKTFGKSIIKIGRKTGIKQNVEISATNANIIIGDDCFINNNCMIISHKRILIGNKTTIGPNCCIYDHDHDGYGGYISKPILIGENVWIGAGSIILKGTTIGNNSVIGAGSLISKSIPENSIVIQKRITEIKIRKK